MNVNYFVIQLLSLLIIVNYLLMVITKRLRVQKKGFQQAQWSIEQVNKFKVSC